MPPTSVDATVATPALEPPARRRPAQLPNASAGYVAATARGAKAKAVASRYLTPPSKPTSISSSSPAKSPAPKTPASTGGSATTTTRTLVVAFQTPTYSMETGRASPASAPEPPKRSAPRAKVSDASQNTYRWPPPSAPCGSRSVEFSASSRKEAQTIAAAPSTALRGTPRRASVDGANEYLLELSSDTDSASSGGDGGATRRSAVGSAPRPSPRGAMSASARFTRDATGTRSERFAYYQYQVMPSPSRAPASSTPASAPVKKRSLFTGLLSSPFSRASLKQPSPSKPVASAFRRRGADDSSSPPVRRSTEVPASAGNTQGKACPTGCGVDGDVKPKLLAAIKAEEEHQLRLLYTRESQWRLVNAQAGAAISSQTAGAEMKYLEEWPFLERGHAHSLSGTTQALTATVLRLPVSDGAVADIQGIRNALSSAVDAMHTIGNSTRAQLPKLARTDVFASQLSRVFIQEHSLMMQCRDLLSTLASMHVRYNSLQGQRIQLIN
ncbi:Protein SNOWY COTYLEDON 3 [Zea mays]|uniref:Protein SNOWY COTYLEDON 3 n=1 Tax=Zea mays TaxID=4577 RepID=A0A3L6G837_MAIZE|nr:Protein SNOWY COTYLEDON 3 [Zea mays]